jgi:hypothetical protein
MKKRSPSSGQNDQLVHWLLVHFGRFRQITNTVRPSYDLLRIAFLQHW